MSLKLYLTTDEHCDIPGFLCRVWRYEPELEPDGYWGVVSGDDSLRAGWYSREDLAALGFPKPGKLRTIEIGECEEGDK